MWVAPFGNPRITGYLLLPEAYRSLSRPSSAPDAKAFPLRSFQLDLASGEIRSSPFPAPAFRPALKTPLRSFARRLPIETRLRWAFNRVCGDEGRGTEVSFCPTSQRNLGSLENYAGSQRSLEIVLLPMRSLERCSTIKLRLPCFQHGCLSVALLHLLSLCSVFKVRSPSSQSPAAPPPSANPLAFLRFFLLRKASAFSDFEARSKHSSSECFDLASMVEIVGIEPATSCLQGRRSPS